MKAEENRSVWSMYRDDFKGIYVLTLLVLIAGLILDLEKKDLYHNAFFLDIFSLVVWIISLILILFKKCKASYCFGFSTYALVGNILGTFFLYNSDSNILLNFYRDTVFIAFILTLAAYFVNKYHAFIIAALYVLFILLFSFLFNTILIKSSVTIIFAMISYSFIIYYFVRRQENTLKDLNFSNYQMYQQNEELIQQQEEITSQRDILTLQSALLENRNAEILEGISFAKSIQDSVLAKEQDLQKHFKQHLIISKPKSVISGDFFWVKKWHNKIYLAVIDCTGHGVPGALVSMVANMYLGRAFIEIDKPNPSQILNYISNAITGEIRMVDSFNARIGMDIALVCIDYKEMILEYSGAFNPLYIIRRDNLIHHEATRIIIGSAASEENPGCFRNQSIDIAKGDRIYLFSDGIVDQFGGNHDKKLGYKRLKNVLLDSNHKCMDTQKNLFWKKWLDWKADRMQIDDVFLIGVEI